MTPFGRKLEQLRRSCGLQQSQLAAEAGVQSCYISAMENGRKGSPSLSVFDQLTQVLTLSEEERCNLWRAALQSKKMRKMPPETPTSEYVLVGELWERLGSLTENQINLISLALKTATSDGGLNRDCSRLNILSTSAPYLVVKHFYYGLLLTVRNVTNFGKACLRLQVI